MYMEMKSTREDAMLLTECFDDVAEDDDYMKVTESQANCIKLETSIGQNEIEKSLLET